MFLHPSIIVRNKLRRRAPHWPKRRGLALPRRSGLYLPRRFQPLAMADPVFVGGVPLFIEGVPQFSDTPCDCCGEVHPPGCCDDVDCYNWCCDDCPPAANPCSGCTFGIGNTMSWTIAGMGDYPTGAGIGGTVGHQSNLNGSYSGPITGFGAGTYSVNCLITLGAIGAGAILVGTMTGGTTSVYATEMLAFYQCGDTGFCDGGLMNGSFGVSVTLEKDPFTFSPFLWPPGGFGDGDTCHGGLCPSASGPGDNGTVPELNFTWSVVLSP